MVKRWALAASLAGIGLAGAVPAQADEPYRMRAFDRTERLQADPHRGWRREGALPAPRHGGLRPVWRGHGWAARPVRRVRYVDLDAAVRRFRAGYGGVRFVAVRPARAFVRPVAAFIPAVPVCASYAAPVGEHGVLYNRPLCFRE